MTSLRDRLLSVEEEFLTALAEGSDALAMFDQRWEQLIQDIDAAMDSSSVDNATAALAHATSLRIAVLADTSIELVQRNNTLTAQLMDQISVLMFELVVTGDLRQDLGMPLDPPISPPDAQLERRKRSRSQCFDEPSLEIGERKTRKLRKLHHVESTSFIGTSSRGSRSVNCYPSNSQRSRHASLTPGSRPSGRADILAVPSETPTITRSLKRRVSDADLTVSVRQPKRLHLGPRLHAVSDSFPGLHTSNQSDSANHPVVRWPTNYDSSTPLDIQPLTCAALSTHPAHLCALNEYTPDTGELEGLWPGATPPIIDFNACDIDGFDAFIESLAIPTGEPAFFDDMLSMLSRDYCAHHLTEQTTNVSSFDTSSPSSSSSSTPSSPSASSCPATPPPYSLDLPTPFSQSDNPIVPQSAEASVVLGSHIPFCDHISAERPKLLKQARDLPPQAEWKDICQISPSPVSPEAVNVVDSISDIWGDGMSSISDCGALGFSAAFDLDSLLDFDPLRTAA